MYPNRQAHGARTVCQVARGLATNRHRRITHALIGGPEPQDPDLTLDHLYRVRNCWNPHHLERVSRAVSA